MASVYTNDLRLEEIGSGEQSGTWGDTTNTNLELIAEGLSYGTEAITTNADTHTSTVADGATDPARSLYIEYTGTLDSACTITIAPNTLSRVHFIENGTSGSQNIIISQGSGANVTIPPGDTKAVYLDGAGSGAAVVDAFASLSVVDLKVQDDLTVTDDVAIGGLATVGGTLGVTGIATFTDDIIIGDGKTIGSASTVGAITIASDGDIAFSGVVTANAGVVVDNFTLDGTSLSLSSGSMTINAADVRIKNVANDETMAQFDDNGAVNLYYDNALKLATASGGVTVTGEMAATTMDLSSNAVIDGTALVTGVLTTTAATVFNGGFASNANSTIGGNLIAKGYLASEATNSTNKWLAYTHTDNTYRLNYNGAGSDEVIITSTGGFSVTPAAAGHAVFNSGGIDADFQVKGDNQDHALFVDASSDNVGINNSSPSQKLGISNSETNAYAKAVPNATVSELGVLNLPSSETTNSHATIQFNVNGGSLNRVGSISLVAESSGNRQGALAFCTDEGGSRTEKFRIGGNGAIYKGLADGGGFLTAELTNSHSGNDANNTADIAFVITFLNPTGLYDNAQILIDAATSGNSAPANVGAVQIEIRQRSSAIEVLSTENPSYGDGLSVSTSSSGLVLTVNILSSGSSTFTVGARCRVLGGFYGISSITATNQT